MRGSTSGWCCSPSVLPLIAVVSLGGAGPWHGAGRCRARPRMSWMSGTVVLTRSVTAQRSGLLRLPEDVGDLVDLREQVVGGLRVHGGLRARPAGELARLVDQHVELRVLLEVRRLEVVGPQHREVVLDQLRALLLDEDGAGPEVRVVVVGDLSDDGLDRLRLEPRLGRVVDAAGKVAVGLYLEGGSEQSRKHAGPFVRGGDVTGETTPAQRPGRRGPRPVSREDGGLLPCC